MRMYHPDLTPPHNECEVMNDRQAAVYAESGWLPVPEPESRPGYQPEPVKYAPDLRTDSEREADDNAAAGRRKRTKTEPVKGEGTNS